MRGAVHPRGCAGRCGARRVLQWLRSFGTILAVLAVPLQVVRSTTQVLLMPLASASRPQRSLTSGCTPWVAGGHLELPRTLLSVDLERQCPAAAWRRAGARAARHVDAVVCADAEMGRARGPDGGWSSNLMTTAAWPVRPDQLPSWGALGPLDVL